MKVRGGADPRSRSSSALLAIGFGVAHARPAAVRRRLGRSARSAVGVLVVIVALGVLALVGRRKQAQGAGEGARRARRRLTPAVCGRYTLATPDPSQLRARFPIGERLEVRRRYNVAPGDDVLAVVRRRDAEPEGALLRWGLVPFWASDPGEVGVEDDQRARRDRRRAPGLPRRVRAPALPDRRRRLLRVVGGHAALDHARGRRAVRVRRAVGVVAPARRRRRRAAAQLRDRHDRGGRAGARRCTTACR